MPLEGIQKDRETWYRLSVRTGTTWSSGECGKLSQSGEMSSQWPGLC